MKAELTRHGAQLHVEGKGEGTFHDTQVVGHLGNRTINFERTDFVLILFSKALFYNRTGYDRHKLLTVYLLDDLWCQCLYWESQIRWLTGENKEF